MPRLFHENLSQKTSEATSGSLSYRLLAQAASKVNRPHPVAAQEARSTVDVRCLPFHVDRVVFGRVEVGEAVALVVVRLDPYRAGLEYGVHCERISRRLYAEKDGPVGGEGPGADAAADHVGAQRGQAEGEQALGTIEGEAVPIGSVDAIGVAHDKMGLSVRVAVGLNDAVVVALAHRRRMGRRAAGPAQDDAPRVEGGADAFVDRVLFPLEVDAAAANDADIRRRRGVVGQFVGGVDLLQDQEPLLVLRAEGGEPAGIDITVHPGVHLVVGRADLHGVGAVAQVDRGLLHACRPLGHGALVVAGQRAVLDEALVDVEHAGTVAPERQIVAFSLGEAVFHLILGVVPVAAVGFGGDELGIARIRAPELEEAFDAMDAAPEPFPRRGVHGVDAFGIAPVARVVAVAGQLVASAAEGDQLVATAAKGGQDVIVSAATQDAAGRNRCGYRHRVLAVTGVDHDDRAGPRVGRGVAIGGDHQVATVVVDRDRIVGCGAGDGQLGVAGPRGAGDGHRRVVGRGRSVGGAPVRVAGRAGGAHAISVALLGRQAGVAVAGGIGRQGRQPAEAAAGVAFDREAGLVVAGVGPAEVDLVAGHAGGRQIAGPGRDRRVGRDHQAHLLALGAGMAPVGDAVAIGGAAFQAPVGEARIVAGTIGDDLEVAFGPHRPLHGLGLIAAAHRPGQLGAGGAREGYRQAGGRGGLDVRVRLDHVAVGRIAAARQGLDPVVIPGLAVGIVVGGGICGQGGNAFEAAALLALHRVGCLVVGVVTPGQVDAIIGKLGGLQRCRRGQILANDGGAAHGWGRSGGTGGGGTADPVAIRHAVFDTRVRVAGVGETSGQRGEAPAVVAAHFDRVGLRVHDRVPAQLDARGLDRVGREAGGNGHRRVAEGQPGDPLHGAGVDVCVVHPSLEHPHAIEVGTGRGRAAVGPGGGVRGGKVYLLVVAGANLALDAVAVLVVEAVEPGHHHAAVGFLAYVAGVGGRVGSDSVPGHRVVPVGPGRIVIGRPHPVQIEPARIQAGVGPGLDLGSDAAGHVPVEAIDAALDRITGLAARVVDPGQVDRVAGEGLRDQGARRLHGCRQNTVQQRPEHAYGDETGHCSPIGDYRHIQIYIMLELCTRGVRRPADLLL